MTDTPDPAPPMPGVTVLVQEDGTVSITLTGRLNDMAMVLLPAFHADIAATLRPDQEFP